MLFWNTLKKKLRKIIPAGRTYLDNKFRDQEKKFPPLEKKLQGLETQLGAVDTKVQDVNQELKKIEEQNRNQEVLIRELIRNNQQQAMMIDSLKQYIGQELQRRDGWSKRSAQDSYLAGGRPVWVIKCPAPEGPVKVRWGDYAYAVTLKRYFDRMGIYTVVDTREDWDCPMEADVVLVLRGLHFYRPDRRNPKTLYIMWNISHPDMVTREEYELYDAVGICSHYYAQKIAGQVKVPVFPLMQCTDTELFYPLEKAPEKYENDYIFIGNTRGVARRCVMWAIEKKLPLKIWGTGWATIFGDNKEQKSLIQAPSIENHLIPDIYRSAKVTLNDHWKDMLDHQFINNRIFDALACGLPVISDSCEELKALFPEGILYYETREDFDRCVEQIDTDYEQIKAKVAAQWPLIKEKYSFEARAKELVEIAEKYRK